MKTCKHCGQTKEKSEFYAYGRSCKKCHIANVKSNRAARAEHYREYERERNSAPERVARRRAYAQTPEGKAKLAAGSKAWAARNPEKRAAPIAVSHALRDKKLTRPNACSACGQPGKPQAHHDDYSKPLDVRWLCIPCHNNETWKEPTL